MDMTPDGPENVDDLVRELDGLLWRIEGNYNREGSGPGSRFEGKTLEAVQARALIRHVWPLAYRASREDAARAVEALLEDQQRRAAENSEKYVRAMRAPIDDLNLPGIKTHGWALGGRVDALKAAVEAARSNQPRTLEGAEAQATEAAGDEAEAP